jgi:hypothetical protein
MRGGLVVELNTVDNPKPKALYRDELVRGNCGALAKVTSQYHCPVDTDIVAFERLS